MTEQIRIPNIQNYTMEFIAGELVLTPKPVVVPNIVKTESDISSAINVTESELGALDVTKSTILECVVKRGDEIVSNCKKYRQVVVDIWKTMMPETGKIKQESTFRFKMTNENGENGYEWCAPINMSFQSKNAKLTLKEIVHMVKVNKYSIRFVIRLNSGEIYKFIME